MFGPSLRVTVFLSKDQYPDQSKQLFEQINNQIDETVFVIPAARTIVHATHCFFHLVQAQVLLVVFHFLVIHGLYLPSAIGFVFGLHLFIRTKKPDGSIESRYSENI